MKSPDTSICIVSSQRLKARCRTQLELYWKSWLHRYFCK